jgi:hypothetical protein
MRRHHNTQGDSWAELTWQYPPNFDDPAPVTDGTDAAADDDDEYGEPRPLTAEEEAEEADHALEGLNLGALRELVWEGLRRRHKSTDHVMEFHRDELLAIARQLAADQRGKRETKLQRIVNPWRMCHTELALRVAVHLLREDLVTTDITIALHGREMTRYGRPMFDVKRFLARYGGGQLPGSKPNSPEGRWRIAGSPHDIVLTRERGAASLVAGLGPGSRIFVHAYPGPTRRTSGGIEGHVLARAIGAALMRWDLEDLDIAVVALPRSPRMRVLVDRVRGSRRIAAAGLSIALVDTVGEVEGLPFPSRPAPAVFDADEEPDPPG